MTKDNNLEWHQNDRPFSPQFNDHFYSHTDGRLECDHVFLKGNDVQTRWLKTQRFTIGELGFGTGLNLLETWRQWIELRQPGQQLHFTSFELYPMGAAQIQRAIAPWPILEACCQTLVEHWPDALKGKTVKLDDQTSFRLLMGDAREQLPAWQSAADAWFLDGFAPSKNPQMWGDDLMKSLVAKTRPSGTFATWTVAVWVRRNLKAAGFDVERCPGHAGKNQMIRGRLKSGD